MTDAGSVDTGPDIGRQTADVRDFYDRFLAHLIRDRIVPNPRHRMIARFIKHQIRAGHRVLDLGCGIGITTELIQRTGAAVTGVDLSPQLIAYARETVQGPEFLAGNIVELVLSHRYDRICLFDCLEHVPLSDHPALVRTLAKHADADARIIMTIPDPWLLDYTRTHEPDKLQIVDESVDTTALIGLFGGEGFVLTHLQQYAVDYSDEYQLLIFQRRPEHYQPVRLPKSSPVVKFLRLAFRPGWWIARAMRRRRYAGPVLLERVRQQADMLNRGM